MIGRDTMINFLEEAQNLSGYTQSLRRYFHMHPELGFHETHTAEKIASELSALDIEFQTEVGETGIVAILKSEFPGPVILLRADMDALPIDEETGVSYSSLNPGIMHACGHDAHVAVLLTVARLLHTHLHSLHGTVKFMFQPAEEGMGGAERMISAGVLDNPRLDYALGLHMWNELPVGNFTIVPGPIMAGAEIFKIKVVGKGGHGANPHLAIDPITASAHIISALQEIVSRNVPPLKTAVLSICTIHSGEAFNVIPAIAEMTGTIRTFDTDVREVVLSRFKEVVKPIAQAMGCQVEIELERLTPPVVNDPKTTAVVQSVAKELFPTSRVNESGNITMGSEDFAFVLEKIPGCFFFIGSANADKGLDFPHHHPKFDIDETALPNAVAIMSATVHKLLSSTTNC